MKNVRSWMIGPESEPTMRSYWRVGFSAPARLVSSGVAERASLRLKYEAVPLMSLVPLLSARLTVAPAVWPDCASNALVCTLYSAMASDGGEKPTTPLLLPAPVLFGETRFGAASRVN